MKAPCSKGALAAAIGVLVAVTAHALEAQERARNPDVQEVRALIERVGTAMEAGDFETLDRAFVSDRGLHIIEGAGVNHGWAEYRDSHLKPELAMFENFSYDWHSIEPRVLGNTAFAAFRYDLPADTERGHIEIEGRGTIAKCDTLVRRFCAILGRRQHVIRDRLCFRTDE